MKPSKEVGNERYWKSGTGNVPRLKKNQNKRDSNGSKWRNVSDGRADGRVEGDTLIERRVRLEPHVSA